MRRGQVVADLRINVQIDTKIDPTVVMPEIQDPITIPERLLEILAFTIDCF